MRDDAATTPAFTGFGEDLPMFYAGLEADNSKAYWQDHKTVYDEQVRGPMEALVAALAPEFGEAKLFRPYRDVRFSKDKSPYKTNVSAVVHGGGAHGLAGGVLYVHVDAEGLFLAGGYYRTERDQIERYRAAVADDSAGSELVRLLDELRGAGWEIGGDTLKRAPRGVDPDHPRIVLLRHKSLTASRRWPVEPWLFEGALLDRVAASWRELAGLNGWLARHVGAHVPAADDRDAAART